MNLHLSHLLPDGVPATRAEHRLAWPGTDRRERPIGRRLLVAPMLRRVALLAVALGLVLAGLVTVAGDASAEELRRMAESFAPAG